MRARTLLYLGALTALAGLTGCPDTEDPFDIGPVADAAPTPDATPTPDAMGDQGLERDVGATDMGAAPDSGLPPPPVDEAPPVLFAEAEQPVDEALGALVQSWKARPTDEASARALVEARREANAGLREAGPAGADRVVEVCRGVPVHARDTLISCLRLLSLTESPRSLDWLADHARRDRAALPEGTHLHDPQPEALAAQIAAWSLGRRAASGSTRAIDHLLAIAGSAADPRHAIRALYAALPRHRAQRLLEAALPAAQHYRLYEVR